MAGPNRLVDLLIDVVQCGGGDAERQHHLGAGTPAGNALLPLVLDPGCLGRLALALLGLGGRPRGSA